MPRRRPANTAVGGNRRHDISGQQGEQRYEDENDAALHHATMHNFNRLPLHPVMATIRAVSAVDQSSNPSSGRWVRGSLSSPCKRKESWVTSWEAQSGERGEVGRLGHGGDFVCFF